MHQHLRISGFLIEIEGAAVACSDVRWINEQMQRSRRALLHRRAASEKNLYYRKKRFYKVSASLVFVLWLVVFLLNLLISKGNGFRDEQDAALSEFSLHEVPSYPDKVMMDSQDPLQSSATSSTDNQQKTIVLKGVDVRSDEEVLVSESSKLDTSPDQRDDVFYMGNNLEKETPPRSDRLSRITPPGLDEFKSKAISSKEKVVSRETGTVIHRVEPNGKEYNYASANKGAKVLAYNKEAKGASNILDKDKDKYLRNPCSAEEKYVVLELSEETLVDTIEIANFEHYSSNFKYFDLFSSLVYPTDSWVKLGNFTAANVKHAQRFSLSEPKWARYLKINLLSHYGSEFFCTLSVVEVYGVDAVERMLEDLISVENSRLEPEEQIAEQLNEHNDKEDTFEEILTDLDNQSPHDNLKSKRDAPKNTLTNPLLDTKPTQVGRMPGDTVLKVLMQKVQTLDLNFSVLERYLEELNSRYGHIFKDFDDDITNKDLLLEQIRFEIKNLQNSKEVFANDIGELLLWKSVVSSQLEQLIRENARLRSEIKGIQEHQIDMENKALAVIFVSFVLGCVAASKLLINMLLIICRFQTAQKLCQTSSGWFLLLLSSSIIASIMVL